MAATWKEVIELLDELGLRCDLVEDEDDTWIRLPIPTRNYRNAQGDAGVVLAIRLAMSGKVVVVDAPWAHCAGKGNQEMMRVCMRLHWRVYPVVHLLYDERDGEMRASSSILLGEDGRLAAAQLEHAIGAVVEVLERSHEQIRRAIPNVAMAHSRREAKWLH